jgi:hypothetical protein
MAQSTQRLVLDLDEIERQLKQTQLQSPLSKSDPLAELARIVGQNDPFKSLLGSERQGGPAARFEEEALFASADPHAGPSHAYAAAPAPVSSADRIEAGYGPAHDYGPADTHYDAPLHELQPLERRRSRRGLLTVALVLGTAVSAVSGALMLRNRPVATVGGEPPTVKAESDPLKIRPENPGGVEIPNQNAQVYERSGPDKQTRVVNREEQPVDVQQAARAAQDVNGAQPVPPAPAIVPPSPGPGVSAPNSAVASLGEPRRVRTVTIRPSDGLIVSPDQPAVAPQPPIVPPAPARPAPAPQAASNGATPAPTARPAAPAQPPRPNGPSTTATPSQPSAAAPPPPASPTPSASRPAAPQRTTAVAPPRPDAAETTSAAGNFTVQLSVTTTEETARAQAQALQRKYAGALGGRSAAVRTAEVNGKTLYRVRVGPMSKDDANELCTKVKDAGGDKACFVARN